MTDNAGQINVQFTITPETVIGSHYVQTGEEDYRTEPETLQDRVASIIAEKVYRDHKGGWYDHDTVNSAVDRIIEDRVKALLDRQVTPTDAFGTAKGAPTTLAEMIDKRLGTWLSEAHKDRNGYGQATSNLQKLIDNAVGTALQTEVRDIIKSAKVEVTTKVQAAAMQVFTETITRAAGIHS